MLYPVCNLSITNSPYSSWTYQKVMHLSFDFLVNSANGRLYERSTFFPHFPLISRSCLSRRLHGEGGPGIVHYWTLYSNYYSSFHRIWRDSSRVFVLKVYTISRTRLRNVNVDRSRLGYDPYHIHSHNRDRARVLNCSTITGIENDPIHSLFQGSMLIS